MKKVYIPTEEELQQLNYLGMNVYKYLFAKVTETLIMEDIIYEEIDMLDVLYSELNEFPEIIYAIAKIYPEKIALSQYASNDIELCRLLSRKIIRQNNSICQLDTLAYFNQESDVVSDKIVIENTVKHLSEHLISSPRYRFDYRGPNILLDNIFACEIPLEKISIDSYDNLFSIDPIYITKLGLDLEQERIKIEQNKSFGIPRGLLKYAVRYNMDELDITNQQEKTKKLVRYLDNHKQNFGQYI